MQKHIKMKLKTPQQLIIEELKTKAVIKHKVFMQMLNIFEKFKDNLQQTAEEIEKGMKDIKDIDVKCHDRGEFETEIQFAGDLLIFQMHTNVFTFDKSHSMWKTSYLSEDSLRSYCGLINVYNFLRDSFKFNRDNDSGYLVARIFINHEMHYFVEGKRQLGFLYNNFENAVLDDAVMKNIIESTILYSLDFDLLIPPYDQMKEVTVQKIKEYNAITKFRTGKRLGYEFKADQDEIQ